MPRKTWPTEKLFNRLLTNKTDRTHWENVSVLRSRGSKEVFDKCVELLQSANAKERHIAVDVLSQLGIPPRPFIKETLKLFFETLKTETDHSIISSIFYGLGHNNEHLTAKETKFICSFKDSKNLEVKQGLVFALGGIEHKIAIDTLIGFTSDKNNYIRDWATFGLGSQTTQDTPAIREALWNRINDKYEYARHEAILGLAIRKDERIKEIIKREIEDIDNQCSLLLEAIEELNDKEFIKILKEKLIANQLEEKVNPEWLQDTIDKLRQN
jgi:HEAT repeat protein